MIDYEVTPKQEPFLSLRLAEERGYYRPGESIGVKLYALKAPKKTYNLKLCRLPLDAYARMERILSDGMSTGALEMTYQILGGTDAYGCTKKDIDLTATGYVSPFSIQDLTTGGQASPGMYMLMFSSIDDVK